jgi:RimJ/RimL family protein N-acetyltransferase
VKVLETERLILRHLEMADVDDLLGIFSGPEAMRYYPGTKNRTEAEEWVRWNLRRYREHGFGLWAAMLKDPIE